MSARSGCPSQGSGEGSRRGGSSLTPARLAGASERDRFRPPSSQVRTSGDVTYGVVVLSVNVSVFAYEPVRSASVAPIDCTNETVTGSFEIGLDQVSSVSG